MMQVLNYEDVLRNTSSSVIGTFDIFFPGWGMTFKKWKLIRTKKGSLFACGPAFSTEKPDGMKQYQPYIQFSNEKAKDFQHKILELLAPFCSLLTTESRNG